MRLDRALAADLRTALRSRPLRLFLLLQLIAATVFVWRRGPDTAAMVALIWVGVGALAFVAWWAGRHRLAHPQADPVPAARAKGAFAIVGVAGMVLWGSWMAPEVGLVLFLCGLGGWTWAALRSGGLRGWQERLRRDPRPFLPLLLFIGLPKLIVGGTLFLVGALLALPSGVGQQALYLVGLFAPLEAALRRSDTAAVGAALLFALVHVPLVLEPNGDDVVAAVANTMLFQANVGLVACLAYQRHRAVLPIGVAHALAIG